ncbi:hypothetical protein MN116_008289 [Schistosoma mekongi]|uniref:CortBP2/NAV1-like AAA+ ATPase lid domain-containing protein n=1 Tax=Schistosoma mekongi TaxID=38744 RepID=A0AAE1Z6E1_SCHME|nr:hypothetical protein MN116_008289 [Schistosoma mekongi]
MANTEQRRKARELYVALKQRYPSSSQSNTNNVISHQQHSNDDTSQTPESNTTLKGRNENQHEPTNVLQQQNVKVGLIKQDGHLNNDEQTDKSTSEQSLQQHFQSCISQKNESISCMEVTKLRMAPSKLDEINQNKDNPAVSKTLDTSNNNTLKQYQMIGNIRCLKDDANVKAVSPDDNNSTIQTCGYQSDGGLEFANYFKVNNNNNCSLDYSMKQSHLTLPLQTKQQSDMHYQLRNSNIIGSLPRNLHSPYFNNQSQMINLSSMKLSNCQISDNEQRQHQIQLQQPEENLGNYARRMHERLQEGMRAAQESLWMPDLPELNMMNRLSNSSVKNYYSSGTQLSDGTVNLRGANSQLIDANNKMINGNGLINEYSSWDLKNSGVCSDVEDLLNQHERRLMSLSGIDGSKKGSDFAKINSASDTEEFLSSDYRIQASMRSMNYGFNGCDPIQPSSSYNNWLRKVNNENTGDGLHNRFFIPPRLSNFDASTPQPDRFISATPTVPQSLLARVRRRQIDGRSSSITNSNNNDDAERIYGIVPLSPSYLYHQFMPSTGMMMSSNSSSIRTNHDNDPNLPGTISAPPGTPIKLPYAAPASLIGTNSGFSCPDSGTQLNTGGGGGVNGSRLSLTSNGSYMSTVEEKQAEEIQILRRKLEQAEKKVNELTTQLTTNAHVVSAFEQSLTDMSQRLQNLSNTTTKKDSELHELKATIDALRNQTEIGLLKKPPISRPCELNRSGTKDTLKQENTLTNATDAQNSNTTGNGQASLTNSSLTTSHSSLTDVESQQSQMDKIPTNASVKSSGSNVKRNGWLRNSLGKAFRKKTSSSINSQSDLDCPTSLQHHSTYSFSSSPQHHHPYLPPCHPSNLPQSPTMDHKGLHVTTNVCQSNSSQSFGHNNSNALSVTSNTHLNGLSPSNSSTSSSSWSTSGISANGQNSSNTANTVPHTNEQVDRLNNLRTVQQQQQHHHQRPTNIDQITCPNSSDNYSGSDKLDKSSLSKGKETRNGLNNNDSKSESNKQTWQDEMNHLKYQLAEKESKLTDVQLEALASAHQLDQLKDEMSRLYTELKYLRTDNERLQILVTHLQQHQQDNNNNTNQKLLFMNNGNITMNNTNATSTTNNNISSNPMMMSTLCNSLPQSILSPISLKRNSLGLDDTKSSTSTDSIVPNQCVTCSNLFIELPETVYNPKYITVLVNLSLTNPDHIQYNHNHPFNSSTNSILYIGVLYLSKLDTWESLNNTIENLYKLYTSYLNLNYEHDLQINEFKQYHQHIDILNSTEKFKSNENLTHYSIHFNKNLIENSQKLTNLSRQLYSEQINVIQLSIEHFPLNNEQMNSSLLKNLNNLMMNTMLNYEIVYFYLELLTTYHCIIFNDSDEMYMDTIIHAFCDHICSSISSTSLRVYHYNLSVDEQQKTMNELLDCLSHHMNSFESIEQGTLTPTLKEEQTPSNSIILFTIQSMNRISEEDYVKIMNYFKVFYTENKDDSTRTRLIYLIGTWITTLSNSMNEYNKPITSTLYNNSTISTISYQQDCLTSIKMIQYPKMYKLCRQPIKCYNEFICFIHIEYSMKCLYTIRCLKKQFIHSLVNKMKNNLFLLFNDNVQYYLNEFYNHMKFFEKFINWIEKVLHYLDQFLLNLQNYYNNLSTIKLPIHHYINPLIFLTLPFNNLNMTESWFINLWNNEIVQYVKTFIVEWSKYLQTSTTMNNNNNNIDIIDPTELIISTWPWYDTNDCCRSFSVQNQQQQQEQQEQGSSEMKSPSLIRLTQLIN